MGLLTRSLVEFRETLANPSRWLVLAFGGGQQTASGILVNEAIALRSTTVMACVRIISETLAQLPLPVYRRLAGGGKERSTDHPLYGVLHDRANAEMTAFDFREILQAHLLTWGNAYAEIERDNSGRIIGLWPMLPDRTWPYRDPVTKEIVYRTRIKRDPMSVSIDDTVTIQLPEEKVLHVKGLGFDGLKGYSVISYARELVAQDLALNEFAGRFFGNGAVPGGVLMTDKKLNKEQHDRLKTSWQEQHQGLTNAQRVAILEEGLKWQEIGIPLKDAQWIEARKYTRNEITSLYRIPPHMVGDVERSTSWGTGIEQQAIGFLVYTISPWVIRWEQALLARLFTPAERQIYFPEFLLDGLVRGDIDTRWKAYAAALDRGVMNPNEVREKENMNPYAGGEIYRVLLTTAPVIPAAQADGGATQEALPSGNAPKALPAPKRPPVAPEDTNPSAASLPIVIEMRLNLAKAQRHVLAEAFERAARRERADIGRGLEKRGIEEGVAFVRDFYAGHREYVQKALLPSILGMAEAARMIATVELGREVIPTSEFWSFVRSYAASAAERYCAAATRAIADASVSGIPAVVDARILASGPYAEAEAMRAANALSLALYKDAGARQKRWLAIDRDENCLAMEREAIGINERFGSVLHPPLHDGCTCIVLRAQPSGGGIVLIRHAHTEYDDDPERSQGWRDIPLTDKGKTDSDALAKDICAAFPIDRIYTSDLRRCSYLAERMGAECGAPIEALRALRSWDIGEFAGQLVGTGSHFQHYIERPNEPVPGGESLNSFIDRYFSFLRPVMARAAGGELVAIVTHSRNTSALMGWVRGEQSADLGSDALSSDNELPVAGYALLASEDGKWVERAAPTTPGGAVVGNAGAPVSYGPGSIGKPDQGWHPSPPNTSQQHSITVPDDRTLLVALLQALARRDPPQVIIQQPEPADMEITGPGGKMTISRKRAK